MTALPAPCPVTEAEVALTRALLGLAERDQRPRCWRDARFTSDDADERAEAALECERCPIVGPCWTAGQAETAGVWGGVDRHDNRPAPRNRVVSP